jgi:hypothetical protein
MTMKAAKKIKMNPEVAKLVKLVGEYWLDYYMNVLKYGDSQVCAAHATADVWNHVKNDSVERQIDYLQMELEDYAKAKAKRAAAAAA